jgi:hypothetical protein
MLSLVKGTADVLRELFYADYTVLGRGIGFFLFLLFILAISIILYVVVVYIITKVGEICIKRNQ